MEYVFLIISLLIAITIHEASHAYVAMILGDPTAKMKGRVTLNPMKHLDPIGTLMILMTFVSGFGIGWGKPVPINPYNFKDYKKGEALVSLAGPMSNFTMALLTSLFLKSSLIILPEFLINFFYIFIMLNIGLMCFNLIPIPPLDGSKLLFLFIPDNKSNLRFVLEKKGPVILLVVILLGQFLRIPVLSFILSPMMKATLFLIGLS